MPTPDNHDERVTGQDAVLKFGNKEINITNVSWTRDVNTTDVQHNDDLNPKILTTGLRYSGSFEYNGRNYEVMNDLLVPEEDGVYDKNEPRRGTLTVTEYEEDPDGGGGQQYIYTFKNVIVTSQQRDLPADDAASTSWDFEAENVDVKTR